MSIELPDLWNASLDVEAADAMLQSIEEQAELLEVGAKQGAMAHATHASGAPTDLRQTFRQARADLKAGTLRGLQVVYRYGERAFSDTFLRQGESVRVVRMDVTERLAGPETRDAD